MSKYLTVFSYRQAWELFERQLKLLVLLNKLLRVGTLIERQNFAGGEEERGGECELSE